MGVLKGYDNITKAAGHVPALSSKEAVDAFQILVFDLINEAYKTIKTPTPFTEMPSEPLISVSLYDALKIIVDRDSIPCSFSPELPEFTKDIREGRKPANTAKKYDLVFENWNSDARVEFGVEAKLLVENDIQKRVANALIREYVSDAGMGKYINKLYNKRGIMVGYIVEGATSNIVVKINQQIEDSLNKKEVLQIVTESKFKHSEIYKSEHLGKIDYSLYHLMLNFN
ncbi:MAG: hypothetical protein JWO09_1883 [Bacteroidetes bacterium]|nr:hypothetical protein [Bacteroidota bacterium]